jgi:KRAB domain-containing zinc finger protein
MEVGMLKQHLAKQHQQTGAATSHKEAIKGEGHLCPDCGKKCQYLSELEIHMAIQHMGIALERPSAKEEEVMCHECGKVFNHRYRLKQHLSTTHNKSRDHPCPFCAKVFCLKHQLTKHLLTHSDVKPFKCKYCDYQVNHFKYQSAPFLPSLKAAS